MEKMKMESVNLTETNVDKIAALFPNCITETADENGKLKKAINFNMLRAMLSEDIAEGDEAYEFTWVGKKAAIAEANRPIRKTLRPCSEESVNWDTTENLYIEGDNLEVLKLLQESYLGKVKMIYIDPPYNTGNDFIYRDDFAVSADEYAEESGQLDDEGNRLFKNTDSNGRFHSDWCSMIYSRLMLARNLLADDGVIFISIDDNEQANLKEICDEIFGAENFITTVCVETSGGLFGLKAKFATSTIVKAKDYVLVYKKSSKENTFNPLYIPSKKLFDTHYTFYKRDDYECTLNDFLQNNEEIRNKAESIGVRASVDNLHQLMSVFPTVNDIIMSEVNHIYRIREYTLALNECDLELLKDNKKHLIGDNYVFLDENGSPSYLYPFSKVVHKADDYFGKKCSCVIQGDFWKGFNEDMGNIGKEGDVKYENGKKPVRLIKNIAKFMNDKECIVLDFFAGSATAAHAVMQLNAEDGGHRKFIMVQLPENLDDTLLRVSGNEKTTVKQTIAFLDSIKSPHILSEIGKERIRRAGAKIKSETGADIDYGFRVLKLDDTNMQDVYYTPAETDQMMLLNFESNIKEDRTDLDLLFGCLLDWGLPLSMPYKSEQIEGVTVHTYNDGDLIACFDKNISESVIKTIAKRQPLRVVFRDDSFADSPSKINVSEIFKMLSPDTRVKVV